MMGDSRESTTANPPAPDNIKCVRYLNVRPYAHPWELPVVEVLLVALQKKFPKDPSMVVERLRGAQDGTYRITTRCDSGGDTIVPVPISGALHDIPLLAPHQDQQGRPPTTFREGTLITFQNCINGILQDVPHSAFDLVMQEHGTITKLCENQLHKGSRVFNGNRYLVLVDPKGRIPEYIQVPKPKSRTGELLPVRLSYKGQQVFCARCTVNHVGQCPIKKAFYEALDARAKMEITTSIVSDSTLRHVDSTGLRADVICMSGGRLGQISHVLKDEPSMKTKEHIIVLAGANDITKDGESVHQFTTLVTTAVQSMASTVRMHGKPKLTIIAPLAPKNNWDHNARKAKAVVYDDLLKSLSADPEYPFTYLQQTLPIHMEDIHPTLDGTKQLLALINTSVNVTWNEDFATNA